MNFPVLSPIIKNLNLDELGEKKSRLNMGDSNSITEWIKCEDN